MQFLIEKQRKEINKCFILFCSLDEEVEILFSIISEQRKSEINSLLQQDTSFSNAVSESIYTEFFSLIHPENLSRMLLLESPLLCKIILEVIPDCLSERVQFYLPPEVISKTKEIPPGPWMDCSDFVIRKFLEGVISNINECIKTYDSSDKKSDIINRVLTLSYEEILTLLKSAGELALTSQDKARHIIPGRNEIVFAGYTLLATIIAEESDKLKRIVLNKFSLEIQEILNSLINDRKEEMRWLKQKSEETFRRVLKMC